MNNVSLLRLDPEGLDPYDCKNSIADILLHLVPHEATLASLIRTVWSVYVEPALAAKDRVMAQQDGCATCVCFIASSWQHGLSLCVVSSSLPLAGL